MTSPGHDRKGGLTDFDRFAANYRDSLSDPWRDRFSGDADFFIHQKCRALLRELQRDGAIVDRRLVALDVGCGSGPAMNFLRDRCRVAGCDVSLEMLRRTPTGSGVAVQEPLSLPFQDDAFDVTYAMNVYHHLKAEDRLAHLREMARVTKANGRVFVFEHNPFNPVTQVVFRRAPVDEGCEMLAPAQLRRLFQSARLDRPRTRYVLFLPERITMDWLEDAVRWIPFGGQYYVVARKQENR